MASMLSGPQCVKEYRKENRTLPHHAYDSKLTERWRKPQDLRFSMLIMWDILFTVAWWRHQMETFSALLAICAGNSPHKGQWLEASMFTLICARINGWVNTREAGDLRRYHAHYDVIVMVSLRGVVMYAKCILVFCIFRWIFVSWVKKYNVKLII